MYSDILNIIKTRDELEQLKGELITLKQSIYKTDKTFEQALRDEVRLNVANFIIDTIAKEKITPKEFLDNLELTMGKIKVMTLIVPFKPRAKTIDVISSWVRESVNDMVILEFQYEPSLLAGVQIIYEGKFFDSSIEHLFEEKFSELSDYVYSKLS